MTTTTLATVLPATGTQHAAVHKAPAASALGKALRTIDDWTAARAALLQLPPHRGDLPGAGAGDVAVDTLLAETLAAGTSLDQALYSEAARRHAEAEGEALISRAINRRREQLAHDLDHAFASNRDRLLRHLNSQLERQLDQARELLTILGPIRDAEAAVDAGLLDDLRSWRDLATAYADLRQAQRAVAGPVDSSGIRLRDRVHAHIAAPHAVDGDYYPRMLGCPVKDGNGVRDPHTAPWPEDWASPEALEWLTSHPDAKPWIPTPTELRDAEQADLTEQVRLRQWLARQANSARVLTSGTAPTGQPADIESRMVASR